MAQEDVEGTPRHHQPVFQWQAREHEHREKSPDWYWALGILALAGAFAAIIFNNILFALLILIGAFVMALMATREPKLITFTLNQRGLLIDDIFYPYQTLDSFWIDDERTPPHLLIRSNKALMPLMVIPLVDVDIEGLHLFLLERLAEEQHTEPLAYRVLELFGF